MVTSYCNRPKNESFSGLTPLESIQKEHGAADFKCYLQKTKEASHKKKSIKMVCNICPDWIRTSWRDHIFCRSLDIWLDWNPQTRIKWLIWGRINLPFMVRHILRQVSFESFLDSQRSWDFATFVILCNRQNIATFCTEKGIVGLQGINVCIYGQI